MVPLIESTMSPFCRRLRFARESSELTLISFEHQTSHLSAEHHLNLAHEQFQCSLLHQDLLLSIPERDKSERCSQALTHPFNVAYTLFMLRTCNIAARIK